MRPQHSSPAADSDDTPPPSKTRRKQQMHALQDLGEALVALDADKLTSLDLPEKLADAIRSVRTMTRHEARRRQLQYIGRLMRDVDPVPLRAALAKWAQGSAEERAHFALLERWRDRVLRDADGVGAFAAAYPHARVDDIARLVAEARDERSRGGPPHKSRALFRLLKRTIDEAPP